jgi:hypothetical protein
MRKPETTQQRLNVASDLVRKVAISLAFRRPKGMSAWQADSAMREAEEIDARISALNRRLLAAQEARAVSDEVAQA